MEAFAPGSRSVLRRFEAQPPVPRAAEADAVFQPGGRRPALVCGERVDHLRGHAVLRAHADGHPGGGGTVGQGRAHERIARQRRFFHPFPAGKEGAHRLERLRPWPREVERAFLRRRRGGRGVGRRFHGGRVRVGAVGGRLGGRHVRTGVVGGRLHGGRVREADVGGRFCGRRVRVNVVRWRLGGGRVCVGVVGGRLHGGRVRVGVVGGRLHGGRVRVGVVGGRLHGGRVRVGVVGGRFGGGYVREGVVGGRLGSRRVCVGVVGERFGGRRVCIGIVGGRLGGGRVCVGVVGGWLGGGQRLAFRAPARAGVRARQKEGAGGAAHALPVHLHRAADVAGEDQMAGIAGIDDHQKLVFLQFPALYVPGVERGDEGILAAAIAAQGAERSGKVIVPPPAHQRRAQRQRPRRAGGQTQRSHQCSPLQARVAAEALFERAEHDQRPAVIVAQHTLHLPVEPMRPCLQTCAGRGRHFGQECVKFSGIWRHSRPALLPY